MRNNTTPNLGTFRLIPITIALIILLAACASDKLPISASESRPTPMVFSSPISWVTPTPESRSTLTASIPAIGPVPHGVAGWGQIYQVVWTPDNQLIVAADAGLFVYDATRLTLRRSRPWPMSIGQLALSSDGRQAVIVDGSVADQWTTTPDVWWINLTTGQPIGRLHLDETDCAGKPIFAPDSSLIALVCDPTKLWDGRTSEPLAWIQTDTMRVGAFSSDGQWLTLGWYGGRIEVWDRKTHRLHAKLSGQPNEIVALAFSPDSATLASLDRSGELWLWDAASQTVRARAHVHSEQPPQLVYSPDGAWLVTIGDRLELRDPATGVLKTSADALQGHIDGATFSPDGQTLLTYETGEIAFWDIPALTRRDTALLDHTTDVIAVACDPDNSSLVTIDRNALLRIRNIKTQHDLVARWNTDLRYWDGGLIIDRAASYLAARQSGTLVVKYLLDGTTVMTTPDPSIGFAVWGPQSNDAPILATVERAKIVHLWDIRAGQLITSIQGFDRPITSLALASHGGWLAMANTDGHIALRKTLLTQPIPLTQTTPPVSLTVTAPLTTLIDLAFSPDGTQLAALFRSGGGRVWQFQDGQLGTVSTLPANQPFSMAWSTDGHLLALATEGGLATVWDVASSKVITQLKFERKPAVGNPLAFCAINGKPLLAIADRRHVSLWDIP